jgi:hypothetical protein
VDEAQGPPSEPIAPSPYDLPPPPSPPRTSRAKITALVVVVLLVLTGAGTVLVLRATNSETSVDSLVPGDVGVFVKVSLHPSAQQQQQMQDLLSRFPSDVRGKVGTQIDRSLDAAFKNLGISYTKDVKPWVGGQIAIAVRATAGSTSDAPSTAPAVVGIIPVKDAQAAQKTLDRLKAADASTPAFEVMGGVVYLAQTSAQIDDFRAAVKVGQTLADNAAYKREHDRAGGDGLVFTYADLSKLGGIASALPGDFLGSGALKGGTGIITASLRAEPEGLVVSGHSSFATKSSAKAGTLKILPTTPDDLLAALSFYDLGDLVGDALKALGKLSQFGQVNPASTNAQQVPGIPQVADALKQFEQALGVNLQKDLLPWLHGEFSIVVGPVSQPPIPDIGIVIEPTDQAALGRTLSALRTHLGPLVSGLGGTVRADANGFTVDIPSGPPIVVRTSAARVVIATGADYAQRLLSPSGKTLADDTIYKAAIDGSKPTVFQLFLRIDRVRSLVEALFKLSAPSGFGDYETNIQPVLKPLRALGIQLTVNGNEQDFRMILTVAKP